MGKVELPALQPSSGLKRISSVFAGSTVEFVEDTNKYGTMHLGAFSGSTNEACFTLMQLATSNLCGTSKVVIKIKWDYRK